MIRKTGEHCQFSIYPETVMVKPLSQSTFKNLTGSMVIKLLQ